MPDYSHISEAAEAGMLHAFMPQDAHAYLQGIRDITRWLTDPTYTAPHLDQFLRIVATYYAFPPSEDPDV